MTATTETTAPEDPPVASDEPDLTPKLSPRWALSLGHLLFLAFWCVFFVLLNYVPLRDTDLWGHVAYGQWILEHRALPAEDPYQPLTEGMRVVDSAWLAQVIFAAVQRSGGFEALSALFAVATLATFAILAHAFFLSSRRLLISLSSVLIVLIVGWSRLATIRPETLAAACFAGLLWLIVRARSRAATGSERPTWGWWIGLGLLMVLWANLHGSFVCGLAVLGCLLLGRVFEVAWQRRDWEAVVQDRQVRQWLYACELATCATLVNPYGLDLLLYTLWFSGNENLADVLEWQPLVILGVGGREFALSWVGLVWVLRHSRQRVSAADVLLLGLFTIAAVNGVRMMTWYAAVYAVVITPHLTDVLTRYFPAWLAPEPPVAEIDTTPRDGWALPTGRRWSYSLIALLLVWMTFAMSPVGRPIMGDDPRPTEQVLSSSTPLGIAAYLKEHPPQGQIFNPQWWGDWLVWAGPDQLQPFVTTNMHVVPRQVWQDYQALLAVRPGWQRALQRYRIDTVVVDKERNTALASALRRSTTWRIVYEDEQGVVLQRRMNEGDAADEPAAPISAILSQRARAS